MDTTSMEKLLAPGWVEAAGHRRWWLAAVVVVLLLAAAGLVYATGGTRFAYLHLMYVPIILAAVVFGVRGGILAGLVAGLLIGPFMPIHVESGLQQSLVNWLSRMAAFVGIGAFAGWLAGRLLREVRRLRWAMTHDMDTGLANRRALSQDLRPLLVSEADGQGVYLMVLRLENLTEILNTLGYPVGNSLLRNVAQRLRDSLPQVTRVYHVSGNRLAALIPVEGDTSHPGVLAEQVLRAMRTSFPAGGLNVHAAVSVGMAHLHDAEGDPDALIRRADIALYSGQHRGMRYALYDIHTDRTSRANLALMGELLGAIRDNHLQLHYQPKLNLRTGEIDGVEALVRWRHPSRGMVPPGDFIGNVENTDLISPLSRWVVEEAIAQQARWQAAGFCLDMAVNVSVKNLHNEWLLGVIDETLKAHGLAPDTLQLEVTESAIMEDADTVIDCLRGVRSRGMGLSIDDFGTGYSSLSYLHEIPADTVKIDRSFVSRMLENRRIGRIVESTIALSHYLNMQVVAEGVESQAELDALAAHGCDTAQGFFVARPMEARALEQWLQAAAWPRPASLARVQQVWTPRVEP
ncbi:MAG: bifunctional diguanylate cyclase/phosphodiesterase [Gammaproteobacteria bacterium]|nr:bifunctional diguanylate cyclase/phosphodiesterase [Gammaproteobacteria bacterium]